MECPRAPATAEAHAKRPTDGRLAFVLARRTAEAGKLADAAEHYAQLLACGAHGMPWHRHEVAAKLTELGDAARAALAKQRDCVVDAADLAAYVRYRAAAVMSRSRFQIAFQRK